MKSQTLKIWLDENTTIDGVISFSDSYPWVIEFTSCATQNIKCVNSDLFECLVDLRQEFSVKKYLLLCNGARVNVYPSPMSRDMGGARLAYLLTLGKQSKREDLIDIFNYAEFIDIGSVEEQKRFYNSWLKSPKQSPHFSL